MLNELKDIIRTYDVEPSELFTALAMTLYGTWLLNPWVNSFQAIPSYRELGLVAPEELWGALFATAGCISLVGVALSNLNLRRMGAMFVCLCRFFLLFFIGASTHFASSAVWDFALWSFMSGWVYLRLAGRK
jgi:hypothetical protein